MDKAGTTSQTRMIKIEGLTKTFGNQHALRGIDIEVEHGESVAVLGPNGAGKTTLIKVLSSIIKPSSGKITIDGLSLKDNAEDIRRRIGVVTHQTFLYQSLTIYENLEFYGRMFDIPQRKQRIQQMVEMIGMTSRINDQIGTFSRGMQQRVSLARALLHQPSIILLDEPESGLDQQALAMLWETLLRDTEEKITLILTTHNLKRGLAIGERLLIMDKGRITYQESSQNLNLDSLREAYYSNTGVRV